MMSSSEGFRRSPRALGLALALATLAALGCTTKPGAPTKPVGPTASATASGPSGPAAGQLAQARATADGFLQTLTGGDTEKASTFLTDALKHKLGPPFDSEEQKLGYSPEKVRKRLAEEIDGYKTFEIRTVVPAPKTSDHEVSARGEWNGSAGRAVFVLRLVDVKGTWRVAEFWHGKAALGTVPTGDIPAELAWARESALNFLVALVAGDTDRAIATMAPAYRAQVAPPGITDSDKKNGYAKWTLESRLRKQSMGAKGFVVVKQNLVDQGAAFQGEFSTDTHKAAFTLHLSKDAAGQWLVDKFEVPDSGK